MSFRLKPCGSTGFCSQRFVRRSFGAVQNAHQSFPTSEDVRGAQCQMRCQKENKEIDLDDHSFIVSPCNVSTHVCNLQECDIKAKAEFPSNKTYLTTRNNCLTIIYPSQPSYLAIIYQFKKLFENYFPVPNNYENYLQASKNYLTIIYSITTAKIKNPHLR